MRLVVHMWAAGLLCVSGCRPRKPYSAWAQHSHAPVPGHVPGAYQAQDGGRVEQRDRSGHRARVLQQPCDGGRRARRRQPQRGRPPPRHKVAHLEVQSRTMQIVDGECHFHSVAQNCPAAPAACGPPTAAVLSRAPGNKVPQGVYCLGSMSLWLCGSQRAAASAA